MNNKHFDLAYMITSSYFSKYQEKIFLENYGEYSKKELDISKIIVFYITLL
jgi:thiamine kinase-like enzyme